MKKQMNIMRVIVALFWFSLYIYSPFQTPYLTTLQLSSTLIGTIVGAYGITQVILRLPAGMMADTVNRHKWFIFLGCVAAAVSSVCRVIGSQGLGFLVGNLFSGFAAAMWISFMMLFLQGFDEENQQRGTGQIMFFDYLGIMAAFVVGTLLYDRMGMMFLCCLSIAAGIICAILALFIKEEPKVQHRYPLGTMLKTLKGKNLIMASLFALGEKGIETATVMSFTNQLIRDIGGTSVLVGISSIIFILSTVVCAALAARGFKPRYTLKFWAIVSFVSLAVYCLAIAFIPNIYLILMLQVLQGVPSGIFFSYLTADAMVGVPGEFRSTAMGFFQAVYSGGITLIPMLTGCLADLYSLSFSYKILGVISCFCLVVSVTYYRRKERIISYGKK